MQPSSLSRVGSERTLKSVGSRRSSTGRQQDAACLGVMSGGAGVAERTGLDARDFADDPADDPATLDVRCIMVQM